MINVSVLFFGATAESVGRREIEIDLAEQTKSCEAFAQIIERFPQINNRHSLFFAVNQEYADGSEIIKNGDELAIFPAVSGG